MRFPSSADIAEVLLQQVKLAYLHELCPTNLLVTTLPASYCKLCCVII